MGGYAGRNELDLGDFENKPNRRGRALLGQMPVPARAWIEAALDDPQYAKLIDARHTLTHSWIPAHFTLGIGQPPKRLDFTDAKGPVEQLVVEARDFAAKHVSSLISQLSLIT